MKNSVFWVVTPRATRRNNPEDTILYDKFSSTVSILLRVACDNCRSSSISSPAIGHDDNQSTLVATGLSVRDGLNRRTNHCT
jgi:hypothetical protein